MSNHDSFLLQTIEAVESSGMRWQTNKKAAFSNLLFNCIF